MLAASSAASCRSCRWRPREHVFQRDLASQRCDYAAEDTPLKDASRHRRRC